MSPRGRTIIRTLHRGRKLHRTIIRFENDKQNLTPNKEAKALENTEPNTEQVRKSESKSESESPKVRARYTDW